MKILAIWITKGLFIFVIYIAEWNVCSNLGIKTLSLSLVTDNVTGTIYGIQVGKIVIINLHEVVINKKGVGIEIARNIPKGKQRTFSVLSCVDKTDSILLYHSGTNYSILAVNNVGNISNKYFGQIVYVTD